MAKYSKSMVKRICDLIAADDYTTTEVCAMVDISFETFNVWRKSKPEFSEAIKKAEDKRLDLFKKAARSGLLTLLQGKEYEEITTEFTENKEGKPKIKSQKKVKKVVLPNPTSVIFTLKNLDADRFADIQDVKHEVGNSFLELLKASSGQK